MAEASSAPVEALFDALLQNPTPDSIMNFLEIASSKGMEAEYKARCGPLARKFLPEELQDFLVDGTDAVWILGHAFQTLEAVCIGVIWEHDDRAALAERLDLERRCREDIPSIGLLTRAVVEAGPSKLRSKLFAHLEIIDAVAEAGGSIVDPSGMEGSVWLKRLVEHFPTVSVLKVAPIEKVMKCLEGSPKPEKIAVLGLFSKGEQLREQLLQNDLDLGLETLCEEEGVQDLTKMDEEELKRISNRIPDSSKADRLKLRKTWNACNPSWKKEVAQQEQQSVESQKKLQQARNELHEAQHELANAAKSSPVIDIQDALIAAKARYKEALNSIASNIDLEKGWQGQGLGPEDTEECAKALGKLIDNSIHIAKNWDTPEDIVNKASGGLARYGFFYTGDMDAATLAQKPAFPVLRNFPCVEWLSPSQSGVEKGYQSYSGVEAGHLKKAAESVGWDTAVSANFSGFGATLRERYAQAHEEQSSRMVKTSSFTSMATQVNSVYCPQKAFRIPKGAMLLDVDAKEAASRLTKDNLPEAMAFIQTYGDHVSRGTHLLGGVLYSILTVKLSQKVSYSEMQKAVSDSTSASVYAGFSGFGAQAGISVSHSTHAAREEAAGSNSQELTKTTSFEVVTLGPNVSSPKHFKKMLAENNGLWHVIDRRTDTEVASVVFVPIWEVLEAEGMNTEADAVRLAWQLKNSRLKDLDVQTLNHLKDAITGPVQKDMGPSAQIALRDFLYAIDEMLEQSSRGKPYQQSEAISSAIIAASAAESRLHASIGCTQGLLKMPKFRSMVDGVITGEAPGFDVGKRFLKHVFAGANNKHLRDSLLEGNPPPSTEDFLTSAGETRGGEPERGQITAVPVRDLPLELQAMSVERMSEIERAHAMQAMVVHSLIVVSEDNKERQDIEAALADECGYDPLRFAFDFNVQASEEDVVQVVKIIEKVLAPPNFSPGESIVVVAGTGHTQMVECKVTKHVSSTEVEVEYDGKWSRVRTWKCSRVNPGSGRGPTIDLDAGGKHKVLNAAHLTQRSATDSPALGLGDSVRLRLGLSVEPGKRHGARASARDLFDLLSFADPHEQACMIQQLSNLDLPLPLYYKPAAGNCVDLLNQGALRYVQAEVLVGDPPRSFAARLGQDQTMPRVAFMSLATKPNDKSASMANKIFSTCFPRQAVAKLDKEQDGLSILMGMGRLEGVVDKLRNWLVICLKGNALQDARALEILKHVNLVVVHGTGPSPEEGLTRKELLSDVRKRANLLLTWQEYPDDDDVDMEQGHAWGCTDYLVHTLSKVIASELEKRLTTLPPLDSLVAGPGTDLVELIAKNVQGIDQIPFRAGLLLTPIYVEEMQMRRDLAASGRAADSKEEREVIRLENKWKTRALQGYQGPTIIQLLISVLRRPCRHERLLGMKELEMQVGVAERPALRTYHNDINHKRRLFDAAETEKAREDAKLSLQRAISRLDQVETSMELLWRELGLMYAAKRIPGLAEAVATYVADGGTIELLNGDTGEVNFEFMDDVMLELAKILRGRLGRKAKILSVSIAGVQSSGKSTLVNAMFGCTMRTSVGTCTRGINMMLVPCAPEWDFGLAEGARADFTLILDTEGICNPLFRDFKWYDWQNNRLTTVAVMAGDICILLNNNEDTTIVQDVLPHVMMVMNEVQPILQERMMQRRILVVYNRVEAAQAADKLRANREQFMDDLNRKTQEIQNKTISQDVARTQLRLQDEDFHYVGFLRKGWEPYFDEYGHQVKKIREHMQCRLREGFCASEVEQWYDLLKIVFECLRSFSFTMSFVNIMQAKAAKERIEFMEERRREAENVWNNAYNEVASKLLQSSSDRPPPDVNAMIQSMLSAADKTFKDLNIDSKIDAFMNQERHAPNKHDELERWSYFMNKSRRGKISNIEMLHETQVKSPEQERKIALSIQEKLRERLADPVDGPKLKQRTPPDNVKRQDIFDSIFSQHLKFYWSSAYKINVRRQVNEAWPPDLTNHGVVAHHWTLDRFETLLEKLEAHEKLKFKQLFVCGFRMRGFEQNFNEGERNQIAKIIRKIKARVHNLSRRKGPFSLQSVQSAIEDARKWCDSQSANCLSTHWKVMLAMVLRDQVITVLEKNQKEWENEHSLFFRLKNDEAKHRMLFEAKCDGLVGQEMIRTIFCANLLDSNALRAFVHDAWVDDLTQAVYNKSYLRHPDSMIAEMNLAMLDSFNEDVKSAVQACFKDSFYEKVLWSRMIEERCSAATIVQRCKTMVVGSEAGNEKYVAGCEAASCMSMVKGAFLTAKDAVTSELLQKRTVGPQRLEELLKQHFPHDLTKHLPADIWLTLRKEWGDDVDVADLIDDINRALIEKFPVADVITVPTWEDVMSRMAQLATMDESASQARCGKTCPLCMAPCHLPMGHEGPHDCFHQPRGLSGAYWVGDKSSENPLGGELVANSCVENVQQNTLFQWAADGKWYSHRDDFIKVFPEWRAPTATTSGANDLVRRHIFTKHQAALAEYFGRQPSSVLAPETDEASLKQQLKIIAKRQ